MQSVPSARTTRELPVTSDMPGPTIVVYPVTSKLPASEPFGKFIVNVENRVKENTLQLRAITGPMTSYPVSTCS